MCLLISAADAVQISELLSKTIADAHARTCFYTLDQIHDGMYRTATMAAANKATADKLIMYKTMPHEELWLECAQKLTSVIQQIIEFAKMVPGFMKLSQDDQIVLLKAGSFELAVLRMSRHYDLHRDCVYYADALLPADAFYTQDAVEKKLVSLAFEVSRSVASLKLTETELALYSAVVLLSPDRQGLKGTVEIGRLRQAILRALRMELDHRTSGGKTAATVDLQHQQQHHQQQQQQQNQVCDALIQKIPILRQLGMLHMEALAKLRRTVPHLEFPALHKELFSVDGS